MQITLEAARRNAHLTQAEAAKMLKISEKTLQNYEAGRSFPTIPVLKRIEELYRIKYDDLIFLQEDYS